MKLIIREYLSLLRESNELDSLLPDLLLEMNIELLSKAQIGVRQYGVDVAAAGRDEDGIKKLFLFTIKQGDVGRSDWDTGSQSVRQSLDEIKDVYLNNYIKLEHKELPIKIVLCTGGDLKQVVELNWKSYISDNTVPEKVEYSFWGGDKLSLLIEKYIFNEQLIPADLRSYFRKTLSLLADTDYEPNDYYLLLDKLLFESNLITDNSALSKKKVIKAFRLIHLCLNIIFYWSKEGDNLKPAILAAERTVLLLWEFIRLNDLVDNVKVVSICFENYHTLSRIYFEYFNKVQDHCHIRDGLSGYGGNYMLDNINLFNNLGIISTTGVIALFNGYASNDKELIKASETIMLTVEALIENHMSTRSPCKDNQIIDISAAIYLLANHSRTEFIEKWLNEMIHRITFSYVNMGKYFPISSDSFDDLVDLNVSEVTEKEKMMKLSTLIPIIAQWASVLGMSKTYNLIREYANNNFSECTLQIWYPDSKTDQYLYKKNAAIDSGAMDAPITLPNSMEEMNRLIVKVQKNTIKLESFTSVASGFYTLPLVSIRHYRTPFLPILWQQTIINGESDESKDNHKAKATNNKVAKEKVVKGKMVKKKTAKKKTAKKKAVKKKVIKKKSGNKR